MIGSVRVTRVLEYSGPTHAPEFLFPDVPKAERDTALAQAAPWLAPHHCVPRMDRLIVTIQLWLVQAGANTVLIDAGVGDIKSRPAPRMDRPTTLVMPWLEAAGAAPERVTHVVHTHLDTDHVGCNTVLRDRRWEPAFPNARYLLPKAEFDYWKAQCGQGDTRVQGESFADSVLPVVAAGLAEFVDGSGEVAGCLLPEPMPGHAPGMLAYRLRSDGAEGYFSTDTMHSPIEVAHPHWNDRYVRWEDQARKIAGADAAPGGGAGRARYADIFSVRPIAAMSGGKAMARRLRDRSGRQAAVIRSNPRRLRPAPRRTCRRRPGDRCS